MTLVCVPITVVEPARAIEDARLARSLGADLIEFRVDGLFEGEGDLEGMRAIAHLVDASELPCIVTCRSSEEGGAYDGDEAGRVALWEHLGTARGDALSPRRPPRYIDVERATYARSANLRQKVGLALHRSRDADDASASLILSTHDFHGRPADLTRRIAEMEAEPSAGVSKAAWRARSIRDNLEAFEFLRLRSKPMIALCMGEFGLMSRVLAPKFGAFLTFATLQDTSATAPGQPTIRELLTLYRFRSIKPSTRVYGVIGWPIGHSRSPHLMNTGFEHAAHDGVYLPMPVPPEWEHFKATLHALLDFAPLDFAGASVTIPHKEHLIRFAREDRTRRWTIDPSAERCGAANTLVVEPDGSCLALNTDAPGALERIAEVRTLRGARAVVLGAGGAARAVASGLLDAGASVIVTSRDRAKAENVVQALASAHGRPADARISAGVWDKRCPSCCEIFVNCTPLGMRGGPDPEGSPLPEEAIRSLDPASLIVETVYTPLETPLLRATRSRGLETIDGGAMFIAQASLQFERWTGRPAPRALFSRVLSETSNPPAA